MNSSHTKALFTSTLFAVCAMPFVASGAVFSDNFDGYVAGSQIHGQGGWKGWDNTPAAGALVSDTFSASAQNSVSITGGSDLVHTFTGATSGIWTFSIMQFVPTGATGDSFVILLNQYNDGGPNSWSVQTHVNMDTNVIIADYPTPGGINLPLIRDQWVEFRAVIDLDTNSVSEFYNGALLSSHEWRDAGALGDPNSLNAITAVDLYGNGASPVFYDNISLIPEASSSALLLLCVTGLAGVRRRRIQG